MPINKGTGNNPQIRIAKGEFQLSITNRELVIKSNLIITQLCNPKIPSTSIAKNPKYMPVLTVNYALSRMLIPNTLFWFAFAFQKRQITVLNEKIHNYAFTKMLFQ